MTQTLEQQIQSEFGDPWWDNYFDEHTGFHGVGGIIVGWTIDKAKPKWTLEKKILALATVIIGYEVGEQYFYNQLGEEGTYSGFESTKNKVGDVVVGFIAGLTQIF